MDDELRRHFEVLLAAQVGVAERDTVVELLGRCGRMRSWLSAVEVECTQRTDDSPRWVDRRTPGRFSVRTDGVPSTTR